MSSNLSPRTLEDGGHGPSYAARKVRMRAPPKATAPVAESACVCDGRSRARSQLAASRSIHLCASCDEAKWSMRDLEPSGQTTSTQYSGPVAMGANDGLSISFPLESARLCS
jgi:hypothetical protein